MITLMMVTSKFSQCVNCTAALFNGIFLWYCGRFFSGFRVNWCSGNAFDPIIEVTARWAQLVLRWVTACGQVNHLGM